MTTAAMQDAGARLLHIEGEMTIYRAAELKQTLLSALEQREVLEVDLSAVTELDTAGVQLLLLAKKTAQAGRRELRLAAHSPAVVDVLEMLNLIPYFGDPIVISSPAESAAAQ